MKAYKTFSTRQTPQNEPVAGKPMAQNSAGGFTFQVDDWSRLERFLILGSEGGTYYASEKKLTRENAEVVQRCLQNDGPETVRRIAEISHSGRAPKNDPALFALAMCAGLGDETTKEAAFEALPDVARIGTHLFHFVSFVEQFRGWGRGLSSAIKKWYQSKPVESLAYQAVKYQSRDGWSHRDLLRLSHPKTSDLSRNNVYHWITSKEIIEAEPIPKIIEGFEKAKTTAPSPKLILNYDLTREMVPTEWLQDASVWEALLQKMPLTAMIRNLGKMTQVGLLKPMSQAAKKTASAITQVEALKKARIHPLAVLIALKTYAQGRGIRGSLSWEPVGHIVDALDEAFYLAFQAVEPTNKRTLLGLDVSGSMSFGQIAGMPLSPREASAAMALVTAKTEPSHVVMGFSHEFIPLTAISPHQRLDDVIAGISNLPFSGTNCALPMLWAMKNNLEIDTFIIYTDNETWYGRVHPFQALVRYRQQTGINAKLIVVGMTSTEFTIADPSDGGMLDIVGFDTAAPQVMADFGR